MKNNKNNVTMRDIASAAGVSLATVSRAMHDTGYVAEDKRRLIFDAAQRLGYCGRISSYTSQNVLAVIQNDNGAPFIMDASHLINMELIRAAHKENLNILTFPVNRLTNQALLQAIPAARKANPVGIIIIGSMSEEPDPQLNALLQDSPIPITCIGHTSNYYNFNRIIVDNTKAVYLAAQHLLKKGHKSLLYVSSLSHGEYVMRERLNGFTAALSARPDVKQHVLQLPESDAGFFDGPQIYEAFQKTFEKHPDITGIVNWSDGLAAMELQYLHDKGVPVPGQVEIIGFDDILTPYLAPPLSSIQMPYTEMADAALQIIADSRRSSSVPLTKTIVLIPKLIVR